MIWFILIGSLLAVVIEALGDRRGEDRKGKIRDAIGLTIAASLISLIACWLGDVNPLKTLALVLGVRVLVFDYFSQWLLIKHDVIVGHWFFYDGKTAYFDRLVSKINPWVRLALRIVLFALALLLYLWPLKPEF